MLVPASTCSTMTSVPSMAGAPLSPTTVASLTVVTWATTSLLHSVTVTSAAEVPDTSSRSPPPGGQDAETTLPEADSSGWSPVAEGRANRAPLMAPPPRSTRKPAACPGSELRTASPAGSKPPTSPMSRSSTSPPGPPKPAPPTTPRSLSAARPAPKATWSGCAGTVMPHDHPPLRRGLLPRLRQPPGHPPTAVLVGGSEEYGYQCLVCEVMWPVLTYPPQP